MARLNSLQISQLNNMNEASQRSGGLGTILDDIQFGSTVTPAVGSIDYAPVIVYSVAPTVGAATTVKAAIALTGSAQTGITAGITSPDVPRNVTIKGNASGITGNVKIYGTDILGAAVTDTIALNGSTEVAGVVAFKTVTAIDYPAETHVGTDTVSIGRGVKIGLPFAIANAAQVIIKNFDGAVDSGTATADATVGKSVFAVAGTMNGTKIVKLYIVQ